MSQALPSKQESGEEDSKIEPQEEKNNEVAKAQPKVRKVKKVFYKGGSIKAGSQNFVHLGGKGARMTVKCTNTRTTVKQNNSKITVESGGLLKINGKIESPNRKYIENSNNNKNGKKIENSQNKENSNSANIDTGNEIDEKMNDDSVTTQTQTQTQSQKVSQNT